MTTAQYPQLYGDYVLLERLGEGGMSQVDLARKAIDEPDFLRFLVIKRVKADRVDDEAFVRMFKDEARITAELHHENIAHVYDFGRQGDEYYMALEYVPGLDLRRIINVLREKKKRIPLRIGLKILGDVCAGLEYAHAKVDTFGRSMNIVHRDVNPRNIMISAHGEVKLIDFGVAKATNRLERTRTDHVKGKFAYMAPEQIKAQDVDHRADLFAVGLTLHEIVTGYGPFYGLSQVQVMHRVLAGQIPELPPPPELENPGHLLLVHQKSLAMNPADRYQDAGAMRADLEKVARPLGGLATQKELVAFLNTVEPGLEENIQELMSTYSGPISELSGSSRAQKAQNLPVVSPGDATGSAITRTLAVSPSSVVAGGLFVGAGAAIVTVVAIGLLALVVLFATGTIPLPGASGPVEVASDGGRDGGDAITDAADPATPEVVDEAATDGADARLEEAPPRMPSTSQPAVAGTPHVAEPAEPVAVPEHKERVVIVVPGPRTTPADGAATAVGSEETAPVPTGSPGTSDPSVDSPATPVGVPPSGTVPSGASTASTPRPPDPPPAATGPSTTESATTEEPPSGALTSMLMVTSEPKGKRVFVDGVDSGSQTPARIRVTEGEHRVEVDGFPTQTVTAMPGMVKMVTFQ